MLRFFLTCFAIALTVVFAFTATDLFQNSHSPKPMVLQKNPEDAGLPEKSQKTPGGISSVSRPPSPAPQSFIKTPAVPPPLPLPPPPPPPPKPQTVSTEELYTEYRPAVLNVWCTEENKATSGTAVMIDPSGVLLTNAHVIKDIQDASQCVLRSWNPFENIARFRVLYIPPQTARIADTELPQNDFALLQITEPIIEKRDPLWQSVPMDTGAVLPKASSTLFIFSFGSEYVGYDIAVKGIPLMFSTLTIKDFATIDDNDKDIDALILENGLSAQAGSSGGPLVTFDKKIIGILSFVSAGKTTGERNGLAILISYIDRVMKKETGLSLIEFIQKNK